MPRKKKVDAAKLIKAVESGRFFKELMAQFGFKTMTQLKSYYLDALVAKGRAAGIIGKAAKAAKVKPAKGIKVNKRGSLVVPKAKIEEMGFKVGEEFSIKPSKAGISLRKI